MQKKNSKPPTNRKVDIDLAAEQEKFAKAARQVEQVLNGPGIPDFLTDAAMVAIDEAATAKGVTIWKFAEDGTEEIDLEALADLFAIGQRFDLELKDDKRKVLRALHELLHNQKTPAELFEAVAGYVNDVLNSTVGSDHLHHHERVLSLILDGYSEDELMGHRREACRATS
jgi:hypothetical protein